MIFNVYLKRMLPGYRIITLSNGQQGRHSLGINDSLVELIGLAGFISNVGGRFLFGQRFKCSSNHWICLYKKKKSRNPSTNVPLPLFTLRSLLAHGWLSNLLGSIGISCLSFSRNVSNHKTTGNDRRRWGGRTAERPVNTAAQHRGHSL